MVRYINIKKHNYGHEKARRTFIRSSSCSAFFHLPFSSKKIIKFHEKIKIQRYNILSNRRCSGAPKSAKHCTCLPANIHRQKNGGLERTFHYLVFLPSLHVPYILFPALYYCFSSFRRILDTRKSSGVSRKEYIAMPNDVDYKSAQFSSYISLAFHFIPSTRLSLFVPHIIVLSFWQWCPRDLL